MTYSIVARDPGTGELGVAVQSHWFSVGSVVPWALPGVGAVATQATAEIAYGPRALALLREGARAGEALGKLLAEDPAAETRQVAVLDAGGEVAVHTGRLCIPAAGHAQGDGVSCQANIMVQETVWPAMLETFTAASGSLCARMLEALEAAEAAGGDLRGRQSAAIVIVPAHGEEWERTVSLRVEDHPEPLVELRRLARLADAYALAERGDEMLGLGRHREAAEVYEQASAIAPDNQELRFFAALGVAEGGDVEAAAARIRDLGASDDRWEQLLARLPSELAPAAGAVLHALGSK